MNLDLLLDKIENNVQATRVLISSRVCIKKRAQLQTCQTTEAQLENGRTEMHWKPWDMWLCSSNSAESIQPSSKHWEERGARRMGPTTDGTISGHLRGLLMEKKVS